MDGDTITVRREDFVLARHHPTLEVGPDAFLAAAVVEATLNGGVASVNDLNGKRHPVFAVSLTDGRRVVVRLGLPDDREILAGAAFWSDQLQALGIAMPKLIARDLTSEFPYLIQGWMIGESLSSVHAALDRRAQGRLAGELAALQATVAALPSAGRFGEADAPERAPFLRWSDTLADLLHRARDQIRRNRVMDEACVDEVERRFFPLIRHLDQTPSLAFLTRCGPDDLMLAADGQFAGLRQVESLSWGDPRFVPARCAVSLLNQGQSPALAEAWLALAGGRAEGLYWFYGAASVILLMAEYGEGPHQSRPFTKPDRARLESLMGRMLQKLDRDMA